MSVVLGCFDDPLLRLALLSTLSGDRRLRVVARDLDGLKLELALAGWAPRVTILSLTTGLGVLERLRSAGRGTRLLVVGYGLSASDGRRILGAGANSVALGVPGVDVLAAVHDTARGERFFAAGDGQRVEWKRLTVREWEVLAFLVQGATYEEVGRALDRSPRTAEKHAESIFRKLGVRGKRELVGMTLTQLQASC
jgi:DNA-binding NarL/FixJ family response regulator